MGLRALAVALVLAVGVITAGQAQREALTPLPDADAFDAAFRSWMQENAVARGLLAVSWRGRLVLERGYGGQDAGERVLLASLSKAITGRCVARLIAEGRLRFDSRVGAVLALLFQQHGEPADARIKDATIGQLLVHRGGLPPAPRDLMTPAAIELLQKTKSPATATPAELLAATLGAPLAGAPGEAFRYSNIGYLVLGIAIEAVTGETYEHFCGRTVLEPAGIHAPRLDARWRSFSSFGGWTLSAAEYVRFLDHDGARSDAGTALPAAGRAAVEAWIGDPSGKSIANSDDGDCPTYYALGQFARGRCGLGTGTPLPSAGGSRRLWHTGSWGVAPATMGLQAMQHESGAAWFAWFTPRPGKDATDALLERLAAIAAHSDAGPAGRSGRPSP